MLLEGDVMLDLVGKLGLLCFEKLKLELETVLDRLSGLGDCPFTKEDEDICDEKLLVEGVVFPEFKLFGLGILSMRED